MDPLTSNQSVKDFDLKPKDLCAYLDRYVVKQTEAKKVLSVAICDHYNHVRQCLQYPDKQDRLYYKQNILVLGPTGVGKTYLIRNIAKRIGVPFLKADATKFSETGYMGGDVEDLVRDLVKSANGDVDWAQYGIIYVDEVDKIASTPTQGKDVSGRGVQVNLLKLMEDTDVNLVTPTDMLGQMQAMMAMQRGDTPRKTVINTRHILFIFSGAFDKLSEIIERRLNQGTIGFGVSQDASNETNALHQATTQDFIKYGFEPEFIGRIPTRVACEPLNKEDLARILTDTECSILKQAQKAFEGYNINMEITREAINEIAARAEKEKTGARGLMTIFERILRHFKFELPSSGIHFFEVNTDTIADPDKALKDLLLTHSSQGQEERLAAIHAYEHEFVKKHGLKIQFSNDGIQELIKQSIAQDKSIADLCRNLFQDLGYGLKLIFPNGTNEPFVVDASFVLNPQKTLSGLIQKNYKAIKQEPTDPKNTKH